MSARKRERGTGESIPLIAIGTPQPHTGNAIRAARTTVSVCSQITVASTRRERAKNENKKPTRGRAKAREGDIVRHLRIQKSLLHPFSATIQLRS